VAWPWLVLFFFVQVCGELLVLPVGLGFFGRFAPKGYEATSIATWTFAGFAGNLLAGGLGTVWSHVSAAQFFVLMGIVAGVASLLLTMFIPVSRRIERQAA
jgi:POT family proton-dependent oligopeptide transporter